MGAQKALQFVSRCVHEASPGLGLSNDSEAGGRGANGVGITSPCARTYSNDADDGSSFVYGPDRARIAQTIDAGSERTFITYVGGLFERHKNADTSVPVQQKHHIVAGGTVAIFTKVLDANEATNVVDYLLRDHIGSVDLVTDQNGAVEENLSFDAWGKRRNTDWRASTLDLVSNFTRRGFTGHEHLEEVGLIHMNGRVYDPTLGRFLSPDPFVQAPTNGQSLNRYSYVFNNPLSFTDPSGFFGLGGFFKKIGGAIKSVTKFAKKALRNPYVQSVGLIAVGIVAGPTYAPFATAAYSAGTTIGNGGNLGDAIFAASGTFTSVTAFKALHNWTATSSLSALGKTVAHGVVGGILSRANGGSFRSGFLGAAASQGVEQLGIYEAVGLNDAADSFGGSVVNAAAAATIGGTVTVIGGGKFANGAVSAAFSRLFNDTLRVVQNQSISSPEIPPKPEGDFQLVQNVDTGDYFWIHRGGVEDLMKYGTGGAPGQVSYFTMDGGASIFVLFIGGSGSYGVTIDSLGNRCTTYTACLRVGLGAFVGGGPSVGVGTTKPIKADRRVGIEFGAFLEGGFGPAGGLSGGVGENSSTVSKGFLGGGVGKAGGGQVCFGVHFYCQH